MNVQWISKQIKLSYYFWLLTQSTVNIWRAQAPHIPLPAMLPEVGKVTLKSNNYEALSDEFLLKSNSNEVLNDVFSIKSNGDEAFNAQKKL